MIKFYLRRQGRMFGRNTWEKTMNEENKWDKMVETDVVEGPVEKVARNEIVKAMQKIKIAKATGPSQVCVEMERQIQTLINLSEMQFRFMPGKGTVGTIFIVRRIQEE